LNPFGPAEFAPPRLGGFVEPRDNKSFLALITFSFTAAMALALAFSVLLAGATLAFAGGQDSEAFNAKAVSPQDFSGVITDSRCGAKHPQTSDKSAAECVRACVKRGAKFALVNGDQTYLLQGSKATLDSLAGERVRITGRLRGGTILVSSITAQ
jgi:hypothetical protein